MYRAVGPVLYNISVTVSHSVVFTGQTLELVATVSSVADLTMPLGKLLTFISVTSSHVFSLSRCSCLLTGIAAITSCYDMV